MGVCSCVAFVYVSWPLSPLILIHGISHALMLALALSRLDVTEMDRLKRLRSDKVIHQTKLRLWNSAVQLYSTHPLSISISLHHREHEVQFSSSHLSLSAWDFRLKSFLSLNFRFCFVTSVCLGSVCPLDTVWAVLDAYVFVFVSRLVRWFVSVSVFGTHWNVCACVPHSKN